MSGNRWGREGPPPKAYSRVTDPERFRTLHDFAVRLLRRLEATFDVERLEGYGLDQELERSDLVRPSVKLLPRSPDAAPIVFVFTAFPGIHVRLGRWRTEAFPTCGCDACDETADGQATRLSRMVDDVTGGRFREAIGLPLLGPAWQESEFWSSGEGSSGRQRIDRSRARQMLRASDRSSFEWKPWPRGKKAVAQDGV